jgi:hypothetical protein
MSKVTKAAMKAAIKQKALLERMLDENLVLDSTANEIARELAFSMVYEEGCNEPKSETKMRKLKQKGLLKRYADVQDEMFARDFRMSLMNEGWENIVWR